MQALIDPRDGRVCEIAEESFPVAAPLIWMEAPEGADTTWVYDGSEIVPPAAAETEPPESVTALQGKLALDDAGLYDAVEAICAAHPVQAVRLFWSSATRWERGHPVISALALELDPPLSEEAVDALFAAAAVK